VIAGAAERRDNQVVQYDGDAIPTSAFRCAECGAVAEAGAEGWKAYIDDDEAVVLFCPECAEREFREPG
jgi:hypothetical protein